MIFLCLMAFFQINCLSTEVLLPQGKSLIENRSHFRTHLLDPNQKDEIDREQLGKFIHVSISELSPVKYYDKEVYVSSQVNLTATAAVTNLDDYKNYTVKYLWQVKNEVIYTGTECRKIIYTFGSADSDTYLGLTVVVSLNDIILHVGVARQALIVRDPISLQDTIGKLFIEHYEILSVTFELNGTAPFWYCYNFCFGKNKCIPCDPNEQIMTTTLPVVNIRHWLPYIGTYQMIFSASNIVNQVSKPYTVKIKEAVRRSNVPYVPIICSALAVFILMANFALHLRQRRAPLLETANFEFEDENENEDDINLIKRLRHLLCMGFDDNGVDPATISSILSGSRLAVHKYN